MICASTNRSTFGGTLTSDREPLTVACPLVYRRDGTNFTTSRRRSSPNTCSRARTTNARKSSVRYFVRFSIFSVALIARLPAPSRGARTARRPRSTNSTVHSRRERCAVPRRRRSCARSYGTRCSLAPSQNTALPVVHRAIDHRRDAAHRGIRQFLANRPAFETSPRRRGLDLCVGERQLDPNLEPLTHDRTSFTMRTLNPHRTPSLSSASKLPSRSGVVITTQPLSNSVLNTSPRRSVISGFATCFFMAFLLAAGARSLGRP